MSKRKKPSTASPPVVESVVQRGEPDPHEELTAIDPRGALAHHPESAAAAASDAAPSSESTELRVNVEASELDAEMTVNLVGDLPLPGRDAPTVVASGEDLAEVDLMLGQRQHLRGLLEALVFASDAPIKPPELAKLAHAQQRDVKEVLEELKQDYSTRGIHLDEIAGGWVFRTSPKFALFVRDLTKQKPVRLTRAQVETLAIIAYRQPITRPEIDDVRGVDTGPVLKLLLERDLVRILGKRDEPGRPIIYGTTGNFLEFFGLKSLKDLPTLREFTELSDESREAFEDELGESPDAAPQRVADEVEVEASAPEERGEQRAIHGEHEEIDDAIDEIEDDRDRGEALASDDDGPTLTSEAPAQDD